MRYLLSSLFSAGAIALWGLSGSAIAQPELSISYSSDSFQNRQIESGNIKVSVSYNKSEAVAEDNFSYTLSYGDREQLSVTDTLFMNGNVSFADLDSDGTSEVVVQTYSGGAHCCTTYKVYTWDGNDFVMAQLGPGDGSGGEFKDINNDGITEFLTFDQSFLYTFSSYAGSFPPSIILSFRDGQFVEVTRQYPERLRSVAWQMYLAIRRNDYNPNGMLAGYVAQKILLGEFEEGWEFMLVHYSRDPDMEYNIYSDDGEVIGRHPNFPAALQAFLMDMGYLDGNGQPRPNANLSDNASLGF